MLNNDRLIENSDAVPPELRTQPSEKDDEHYRERVEPLTVLSRQWCGVHAEIVRIFYWLKEKGDGGVHYQVNLIQPDPVAFHRTDMNVVSVDHGTGARFPNGRSELEILQLLLRDAAEYVRRLEGK